MQFAGPSNGPRKYGYYSRYQYQFYQYQQSIVHQRVTKTVSSRLSCLRQFAPQQDSQLAKLAQYARPKQMDTKIWGLVLPQLATNLLDPIMNLVDAAIVGRLGTNQLAGVGFGGIGGFILFIFAFLSLITTPKVAREWGKGNKEGASLTVAIGIQLGAVLGILCTLIVWFSAPALVELIRPDPEVGRFGLNYMKARCISNPFLLVQFVVTGAFRGVQDAQTPFTCSMIANAMNLGLDILFIFGFSWGVTGAAMATAFSQIVCSSLLVWLMIKRKILKLDHLLRPPPWQEVKKMLLEGVQLSTRSILLSGTIIYANLLAARLGAFGQAGYEILRQLYIFLFQFYECFNGACQSLVSAAFGSNQHAYARAIYYRSLFFGVVSAISASITIYLFRNVIFGIFTQQAEVITQVSVTLPVLLLMLPLDAITSISDGMLLAGGQSGYMARISMLGAVLGMASLQLFAVTGNISLVSIWLGLRVMMFTRLFSSMKRIFFDRNSPLAEGKQSVGTDSSLSQQQQDPSTLQEQQQPPKQILQQDEDELRSSQHLDTKYQSSQYQFQQEQRQQSQREEQGIEYIKYQQITQPQRRKNSFGFIDRGQLRVEGNQQGKQDSSWDD